MTTPVARAMPKRAHDPSMAAATRSPMTSASMPGHMILWGISWAARSVARRSVLTSAATAKAKASGHASRRHPARAPKTTPRTARTGALTTRGHMGSVRRARVKRVSAAAAMPRTAAPVIAAAALMTTSSAKVETRHDADDARSHDDHEQHREDAEHEREDHLDGNLHCFGLCAHTPLEPHLGCLRVEHAGQRETVRLRLDDRPDELLEIGHLGAFDQVLVRHAPRHADLYVLQRTDELRCQDPRAVLRDPNHGGVESEACLDRDAHLVEGVRELQRDLRPALDADAVQTELGQEVQERGEEHAQAR